MKLSILVPVFNERPLIEAFWERLKTAPIASCPGILDVEILVVDDGSTDGTLDVLRELCAQKFVFTQAAVQTPVTVTLEALPRNTGKGAALRRAIWLSTGDIVIVQDADLEYSMEDYPALLAPLLQNLGDAVYGSRFTGSPRRVLYFWHSVANAAVTLLSNCFTNLNLSDVETGYKVIRGPLLRSLKLTTNRFGIDPEITSRLSAAGARIFEVPIQYQGRTYQEGKKITFRDAVAAVYFICKFGIWDRAAYTPGLNQTLRALEDSAQQIYHPLLEKGLRLAKLPAQSRILEIGAGVGSLTQVLLRHGRVVATDLSKEYVEQIESRYPRRPNLAVHVWDATQPYPRSNEELDRPGHPGGRNLSLVPAGRSEPGSESRFDCITAFNVLEHLEHDVAALSSWRKLLAPDGKLLLLVPNYPSLFSEMDRIVGHYRRYNKQSLGAALEAAGFQVDYLYYGNPLGILGWLVNKLTRSTQLSPRMLGIYSLFKASFGILERPFEGVVGLNLVVVARASNAARLSQADGSRQVA